MRSTPTADFDFARAAGVMFDPVALDHDAEIQRLIRARDRVTPVPVANAFLASLSSRSLELRSALGSFAVARHMPDHQFTATAGSSTCIVCGRISAIVHTHDLNVLNFERYRWGGVRHADPMYIVFDLEQFATTEFPVPAAEDLSLLRRILETLGAAAADSKLSAVHKRLATVLKGNSAERRILLCNLGHGVKCEVRKWSAITSSVSMTKRQIGIGALIVLMISIAIWVSLPKHSGSSRSVANGPVTKILSPEAQVQPVGTSTRPVTVTTLDLWARPPAKVAARHLRRTRFAELKRLGASEPLVDRLTDGDVLTVVTELKEKARRGDPAAANILSDLGHSLCAFAAPNLQEAPSLPGQDTEWLNAALQEKIAFNKQLWVVCQQSIDLKEVDGWVAKAAEQGNGASLLLLSFGSTPAAYKQKLVEAVDTGYPEAQAAMAQILTQPPPGVAPGGPDDGEENLFKKAAATLPYAEGALALCEFNGCPGVAIDIPAAVSHAREASQRGAFDAMLEIGPQVQASVIDPDEAAAWNLLATMLAQQGCSFGAFSPQWMAAATNTLTAKKSFDKARSLAEQYWRDYGAQIVSTIGCSS